MTKKLVLLAVVIISLAITAPAFGQGTQIETLTFDTDTTQTSDSPVEYLVGPNGELGILVETTLPSANLSFISSFGYRWCEDKSMENCSSWESALRASGTVGIGPRANKYEVGGEFAEGIILVRFGQGTQIETLTFDTDTTQTPDSPVEYLVGPNGELGILVETTLPSANLSFISSFGYRWCEDKSMENCSSWESALRASGTVGIGPRANKYEVGGEFAEGIILVRFGQGTQSGTNTSNGNGNRTEMCQLHTGWYHGSATNPAGGESDDIDVEAWVPVGESPNWNPGDYTIGTTYAPDACTSYTPTKPMYGGGSASTGNNAANVNWSYTDGYFPSGSCDSQKTPQACQSFSALQPLSRAHCPSGAVCGNVGVQIPGTYDQARAALLAKMPAGNSFVDWDPAWGY